MKSIAIGAALLTLGGLGCGGGDSTDTGPLGNVQALVVLQRPRRSDNGDIFQYTSYIPGARLVKLSPPTADGQLTVLCCDKAGAEFAKIDISGYDLSFDAKQIVFAGMLAADQHYGLFLLSLEDGSVKQLASDPMRDFVSPIFLPGNKIMFTTNSVVEAGAPQHEDEYERGTTTQLGRINTDGTGLELGPRNLSHRALLSLASDGRVVFTQWDHLGPLNEGNLMFVEQDMQGLREGFGKEGKGASNSTLKAREISPGRYVAIATARNRTLTAGALIDVRLGDVVESNGNVSAPDNQSEANSTYKNLTPDVPLDNKPSASTIGRYFDAYPLNAKDKPDLLVSWADGPVESGVLAAAGSTPNFGIYTYDSVHQQRHPILDDPNMWDIYAQPLQTRTAPNIVQSAQDPKLNGTTMIGSLNVYDSTLHTFAAGSIYGIRVMEGFSSEEGFPRMFGTREFEGHTQLGIAPVQPDGSWSATIPADVPVHIQTIDKFGLSLFTEPVWISGRPGEARMCGGCHEDRTKTTLVTPGQLDTFATGATDMLSTVPRASRVNNVSPPPTATKVMGLGWSTQIQPILDNHCTKCHGDPGLATHVNIAGYTLTDPMSGQSISWTFDLRGDPLPANIAAFAGMGETYSSSYFSMAGPDMEAVEDGNLMMSGNYKVYMQPEDAANSLAIQMLNPVQQFPTVNTSVRAFATQPHLLEVGEPDMTPAEYYALSAAPDMGLNFFARENKP